MVCILVSKRRVFFLFPLKCQLTFSNDRRCQYLLTQYICPFTRLVTIFSKLNQYLENGREIELATTQPL